MFRKNFLFGVDADTGYGCPLSFKIDVPRQGNYKVVLTIQTEECMKDVLIFTGRRRLGFRGDIPAGKFVHTMIANVCDFVPGGQTRIFTDKTLDVTVVADKPRISEISIEEFSCPTIYIVGDSVAADHSAYYPYAPKSNYAGWGQLLSVCMNDKIAVSNHARGNANMDSFRKEGHFAIINQYSKNGDFLFMQFGHDDRKSAVGNTYCANLVRYVNECKDRGVYPVIVTPIARATWNRDNGACNDLLAEYAKTCIEVGDCMEVPVLDLYKLSMESVLEKGDSNDYDAYKMAGFVASEIKRVCSKHPNARYRFLAKCVTEDLGEWNFSFGKESVTMSKKEMIAEE